MTPETTTLTATTLPFLVSSRLAPIKVTPSLLKRFDAIQIRYFATARAEQVQFTVTDGLAAGLATTGTAAIVRHIDCRKCKFADDATTETLVATLNALLTRYGQYRGLDG